MPGEKIILVREETKPEDIHGFFQAQGILTSRGGKTSHAAVVARGMGKPCVSGCEQIVINDKTRSATDRRNHAARRRRDHHRRQHRPCLCRRSADRGSRVLRGNGHAAGLGGRDRAS